MAHRFKYLAFLFLSLVIFNQSSAKRCKVNLGFDIPERICQRDSVEFINTSTVDSGEFISFKWYFEELGELQTLHAKVAWSDTGIKKVVLIAYDSEGDSSTLEKHIRVIEAFKPEFKVESGCCNGQMSIKAITNQYPYGVKFTYWFTGVDSNNVPLCDSVNTTQTATLVAEHPNGCIDSSTKEFNIYLRPTVDFTYIKISSGFSLKVKFTGPDSMQIYQWRFGDGSYSNEQNPVHDYKEYSQSPTVSLAAKNEHCWDGHSETIPNVLHVSRDEFEDQNRIEIYPNPSGGKFTLQNLNGEVLEIEVYNDQGKNIEIISNQIQPDEVYIELPEASIGVYFVKILTNKGTVVKKLIINQAF
ncbi:T9SS type A sorting domain-containing protein [bacterium]|nr:T9SS type A sorting domain-containing protein [bacterium]